MTVTIFVFDAETQTLNIEGLPEISIGSSKQIAWAYDIRDQMLRQARDEMKKGFSRALAANASNDAIIASLNKAIEAMNAKIAPHFGRVDARFWINNAQSDYRTLKG